MPAGTSQPDIHAGKRLALIRKELGMTQHEFAECFNVPQGSLANYERGAREIPISLLKDLYIKKNISPVRIISNDKEAPSKSESKSTSQTITNILKDMREMKAEVEILRSEVKKLKSDIRILSKSV